ncbi:hypothetical protein J2S51_007129 [Streptomyces sp. DSM 41269]|nr:hypothetical protein [Streptomyces sp. DSM 41269]
MPLPYFEVDVPIRSTEAPGKHGLVTERSS